MNHSIPASPHVYAQLTPAPVLPPQFQAFTQYRGKPDKSPLELEQLRDSTVWSVLSVLNVLHSLVEKSNINQQLEVKGG